MAPCTRLHLMTSTQTDSSHPTLQRSSRSRALTQTSLRQRVLPSANHQLHAYLVLQQRMGDGSVPSTAENAHRSPLPFARLAPSYPTESPHRQHRRGTTPAQTSSFHRGPTCFAQLRLSSATAPPVGSTNEGNQSSTPQTLPGRCTLRLAAATRSSSE